MKNRFHVETVFEFNLGFKRVSFSRFTFKKILVTLITQTNISRVKLHWYYSFLEKHRGCTVSSNLLGYCFSQLFRIKIFLSDHEATENTGNKRNQLSRFFHAVFEYYKHRYSKRSNKPIFFFALRH